MKKLLFVLFVTVLALPLLGNVAEAASISTVGVPASILRNWRILPNRRTSAAVLRYIEMKEAEEEARERAIVMALINKSKAPALVAPVETDTNTSGHDGE